MLGSATFSDLSSPPGFMVMDAVKDVLPERVPPDAAGQWLSLSLLPNGQPFVTGEINSAGSGAGAQADGVDVIDADVTNCMNMPLEAIELYMPFLAGRYIRRASNARHASWHDWPRLRVYLGILVRTEIAVDG